MNKTLLCGNLGADAEIRYTGTGTPVANFRMATNEYYKNGEGERQQRTEWHRCVIWGKLAESVGPLLKKGKLILLEGMNKTRQWTDKDGHNRYTTEVVGRQIKLLDKRDPEAQPSIEAETASAEITSETNAEVPF